jgi:predicted RNA binding protein YcfA (HicA-like mRNA interferase family)
MSRRDKLLARIQNNPKNVRFDELVKLLESYGFELVRSKGSHHVYLRGDHRITLVWQRPQVDPAAVDEVLDYIAEIEAEQ